ncbi:hypothetical protein [Roseomonas chloroacetimidivorans]|uniref:hypothetical protein n=1 Tax=Roseomonas chloroacetimidivorans TaxID=1766656 RepID=UPI003C7965F2
MPDQFDLPSRDRLEQALATALQTVLRQRAAVEGQAETLKILRSQLGKVLAEAPFEGDAIETIAVRARLAALCDAEITKLEARVS